MSEEIVRQEGSNSNTVIKFHVEAGGMKFASVSEVWKLGDDFCVSMAFRGRETTTTAEEAVVLALQGARAWLKKKE